MEWLLIVLIVAFVLLLSLYYYYKPSKKEVEKRKILDLQRKELYLNLLTNGFVPCKAFLDVNVNKELFLDFHNDALCEIDYSEYTGDLSSIKKHIHTIAGNASCHLEINGRIHHPVQPYMISQNIIFIDLSGYVNIEIDRNISAISASVNTLDLIIKCSNESVETIKIELYNRNKCLSLTSTDLKRVYVDSLRLLMFLEMFKMRCTNISQDYYALKLLSIGSNRQLVKQYMVNFMSGVISNPIAKLVDSQLMVDVILENIPAYFLNRVRESEARYLSSALYDLGADVELLGKRTYKKAIMSNSDWQYEKVQIVRNLDPIFSYRSFYDNPDDDYYTRVKFSRDSQTSSENYVND
jgi:hypothetical protein